MGICLCTMCMPAAYKGQKKAPDPPGLELQIVVSCQAGAGKQAQVVCKSSKCSETTGHLSSILTGF